MSKDPVHGASKIEPSKRGLSSSGLSSKWLLGAAAAVVLAGGAYAAWTEFGPAPERSEIAYDDTYDEDALRASSLDASDDAVAASASAESSAAPAPSSRTTAPRATASASDIPEDTIGITPASASAQYQEDDVIVTAPWRPVWARTPSARRLSAMYPARALERGREGEARLACIVENNGALDCDPVSATPGGFRGAALRVANTLRHAPQRADGADAAGTPVNLRVVFRIEDNPRG